MSEKVKITLSLTKEAVQALDQRASSRRRGEFVSAMLESLEENQPSPVDHEKMHFLVTGLMSEVKSVQARLTNVETQLAALIARR